MSLIQSILSDLENELQVGPLRIQERGFIQLFFEGGLVVMIKIEEEPPTFTFFCRVGVAPDNHPDFAEELLSSNMFWRDTSGATLSLDRESRSVLLAKQLPAIFLAERGVVAREMTRFIQACREWILVTPRLACPSDSNVPTLDNLMTAASR